MMTDEARRRRRRGGGVWEVVSPSHVGEEYGEGACPLPRKKCTFNSEMTTFLCVFRADF